MSNVEATSDRDGDRMHVERGRGPAADREQSCGGGGRGGPRALRARGRGTGPPGARTGRSMKSPPRSRRTRRRRLGQERRPPPMHRSDPGRATGPPEQRSPPRSGRASRANRRSGNRALGTAPPASDRPSPARCWAPVPVEGPARGHVREERCCGQRGASEGRTPEAAPPAGRPKMIPGQAAPRAAPRRHAPARAPRRRRGRAPASASPVLERRVEPGEQPERKRGGWHGRHPTVAHAETGEAAATKSAAHRAALLPAKTRTRSDALSPTSPAPDAKDTSRESVPCRSSLAPSPRRIAQNSE